MTVLGRHAHDICYRPASGSQIQLAHQMTYWSDRAVWSMFAFGAILIYLAAFFPRAIGFIPRRRWFFFGPETTPGGAILIGCAAILFGLVAGNLVPEYYKGLAVLGCFILLAVAFLYDLSHSSPK